MRKILIPTDFSENAMNAIHFALELFKYERYEFLIFHAYADEVYDDNTVVSRNTLEKLKKSIHEKSNEELKKILVNINKVSPNPRHQYKTISVFGTLIDVANDLVDQKNIDIIIMGTKGKTNDQKLTFGSNTFQVLRYVKCPVLTIPEKSSYKKPKQIVFPTDYRLPYKRRELKLLSTLTISFRSKINLLYITRFTNLSLRQQDNKAFLESCFPNTELVHITEKADTIVAGINKFIKTQSADMLVMVNSRHSYLESMLYQSKIDSIGLNIKIPFLVLQNLQRT
ncbi:universal stress protein [Aquimarina sp. 2201CG5-10]|uniref:universal stress protein n=1 Tax=Aquimarina callyspongiae TaxID=3098150 RepID=UPI002AB342D4|nr:universal stress protein [Aquimarina sp. 2201CG5-10]MDY8134912.1 universal stress protein [Aquimarina sp. 2201CG5-10]